MKNKLLLALAFIIAPVLLESCCGETYRYAVTPGELALQVYNDADFLSGETTSVHADNLAIRFDFPDAVINTMADNNLPSLGYSAYATSCDDEFIYIPDVQSVSITANRDYNSDYPAGADLSALFKAQEYYHQDSGTQTPTQTGLEEYNLTMAFSSYFVRLNNQQQYNTENTAHPFWVLKPNVPPTGMGQTFIFTVTVTFTDDAVVSSQTPPITLE